MGVLKTSFFIKEKFFFSSFFASLSLLFFAYSIKQNTPEAYVAMFLATFIGNYLPPKLLKKFEKDKIFKYEVMAKNMNVGKKLTKELRK